MLDLDTIFWNIFNFLDIFIYYVLFNFLIDYSNKKIISNKKSFLFLFFISLINFFMINNIILISIFLCAIFFKINYNEKIFKCITYSAIYWIIVYRFIEYFSTKLIFIVNYSSMFRVDVINENIVIIESMIFKIILMLIIYIFYLYIISLYKSKKVFEIFIFIPIITNILSLLIVFRYIALHSDFVNINIFELIIMPSLILVSNIVFFIIIKNTIHSYNIKYENKILKDNILKEYNYYLKINEEQDKVKEIYHDIKNHMICMRYMCENNDIKKVINYIDNIELGLKKYSTYSKSFNTGNMIVDSILKNKNLVCEEKSIHFDVDVDFSKNNFMKMIDICIIFSNIIDNAIEACDKIESDELGKKIRIESKYINQFCIIVIENTKVNKVVNKNNAFLTSKNNSFIHGIGLRNVQNTVRKYFGEVIIEHYKSRFILKIMIPCK